MSGNRAIRLYCQEIGRELELPRRRRRDLLASLRQELEEQFSAQKQLTLEDLLEAIGPPEDTAGILLEGIDPEEIRRYRAARRRRTLWAIAAVAAMLAVAVGFLLCVESFSAR